MTDKSCGSCKFSGNSSGYDFVCKRYPPTIQNSTSKYPPARAYEWCGEFQPNKENRS